MFRITFTFLGIVVVILVNAYILFLIFSVLDRLTYNLDTFINF